MNYTDLQEIIKHLKKSIPCNSCKKKFANEGLHVITTFQNEALLHLNCFNCHNQLLLHVAIVNQQKHEHGEGKNILNIQAHQPGKISTNEILDIHNFLNQFNGDFKELFTN